MNRFLVRIIIAGMLVIGWSGSAAADWKFDIGYTALQEELGSDLPTGAGVKVTQLEAASGKPDPGNAEFAGKTFTLKSSSLIISDHATTVGQYFYGNSTSLAPGITSVDCYDATNWRSSFLGSGTSVPLVSSSRVANHSYLGTSTSATTVIPYLARLDWVVARDEYIQVVAMNNGGTNYPIMGSSFNAIAVGLSNGGAAQGSYPLATTPTTPYALAGTRPDLVAPASATSYATPMVASAAALLVAEGHQGGKTLSTDPLVKFTTNRNGDTIYNAERSEVVKAALMAGADRTSPNLTNSVTPNGYTINTANGLNNIYGAGQLNIYNSYHIIAAGEQNSREDFSSGGGAISALGFDYDPYFGGLSGSNKTGSYIFTASTDGTLSASLVWNLNVTGPTTSVTSSESSKGGNGGKGGKPPKLTTITTTSFNTTATLYNLGLYLYDMTSSSELAYAASLVDNTENIWYTSLLAGHDYLLEVVSLGTDFLWDYGLSWNITAGTGTDTSTLLPSTVYLLGSGAGTGTDISTPLPPTVYLLGSGLMAILVFRRKRKG